MEQLPWADIVMPGVEGSRRMALRRGVGRNFGCMVGAEVLSAVGAVTGIF